MKEIPIYFIYSTVFLLLCLGNTTTLSAQSLTEVLKAVASDRAAGDEFGYSVAIDGDHAIVGAYGQETDALGSATLSYAGAAYVYKLTFPVTTKELLAPKSWTLFPNPAVDYLLFEGLTTSQTYQIVDVLGRVLQTGTANPNQSISVQRLGQGMYYLRLENGEVAPFVKR